MIGNVKIESKATFVRATLTWGLLLGLVGAVFFWYLASDRRHQGITLVTGVEGGLYNQFGVELKKVYERRTGRSMTVVATEGSAANRTALIDGDAQIAIVQAGSVDLDGLDLFCSLYPEVIHLVVRNELPVRRVEELAGRKIVLGPLQSGMRKSGMEILKHYQILDLIVEETDRYFDEILEDEEIDGAVVTTGIFNPDLQRVLGAGHFRLLPIPAAGAIQARSAHLQEYLLPMGIYGIHHSVPSEDLPTLATTALLVGQRELPPILIRNLLEAVFEGGLHYRFPTLFRKNQMLDVGPGPLAEEADLFFNPADRIGQMANIMESIAAFKELVFALFAGLYLLWGRFKKFEEDEKSRLIQREKDRLDELLIETLRIEEKQVGVSDPEKLRDMLNEVTRIKLKALRQLTHEDLRGDRVFLIFLTQCANLIGKIQAKMIHLESSNSKVSEK